MWKYKNTLKQPMRHREKNQEEHLRILYIKEKETKHNGIIKGNTHKSGHPL